MDIFLFGVINLVGFGRHLFAGTAVNQDRIFTAFAQGNANAVDSRVPSTDDDNAFGGDHALAQSDSAQVVDATFREAVVAFIFTFDAHRLGLESTGAEEDRVVLFFELTQRDIAAELDAIFDFNTKVGDNIGFALQQRARHTIVGNADCDRTARLVEHVDYLDLVPFERQVIGAGQTSRASTNDDNLFPCRFLGFMRRFLNMQ